MEDLRSKLGVAARANTTSRWPENLRRNDEGAAVAAPSGASVLRFEAL
jgi:hypothetical protein